MSAKKVKPPMVDVQFKVILEVNTQVPASSLVEALEKAAAIKYSDLVQLTDKVQDLNDYDLSIVGAFKY